MAYYIGLMSGTSMDAIDAALLDLKDNHCRLIAKHSHPIPAALKQKLYKLIQGNNFNVNDFGSLDITLGRLFAAAANQLIELNNLEHSAIAAIGSHGQTVFHAPDNKPAFTLQIGDPNCIAQLTGITTVADFRRRDMAAGGQGAPLVPAFHDALFRLHDRNRVILNIGGVANITVLPAAQTKAVSGFDTGPGNNLMNGWIQRHQKQSYDNGGKWAASGTTDEKLLERLLRDKYFQQAPPKSTGPEHFNQNWLDANIKRHGKRLLRKNVQATLCELTAQSIAAAIHDHAPTTDEVLVCGGGVHNLALLFRLQCLLGTIKVISTEDYGIDPDYVEAMAFAWLAKQTLANKPGNMPAVTGAKQAVVLGGIYPAPGK